MTTIKDIARVLNVSTSTVSRAINRHPEISVETTKLVLDTAKSMGYIPNRNAQQLVGSGNLTIGFTIPDINDSFFAKCAVGAEDVIRSEGHDIVYHSIQRNTQELCEFLMRAKEFRYGSVIITPEYWDDQMFQAIDQIGIPTVILRRKTPAKIRNICYADSDHYGGERKLCTHLIQLGHRNISFITYDAIVLNERKQGYIDTMNENGLRTNICQCQRTTDSDQVMLLGYLATQKLMREHPETTAIIGANDLLAVGAMQALNEMGISIPEGVSVAGFDNRSICDLYNIQLTTVEQPLRDLGFHAAQMALQLAKNPKVMPESIVMKTRLIIRSTTSKPREQ